MRKRVISNCISDTKFFWFTKTFRSIFSPKIIPISRIFRRIRTFVSILITSSLQYSRLCCIKFVYTHKFVSHSYNHSSLYIRYNTVAHIVNSIHMCYYITQAAFVSLWLSQYHVSLHVNDIVWKTIIVVRQAKWVNSSTYIFLKFASRFITWAAATYQRVIE